MSPATTRQPVGGSGNDVFNFASGVLTGNAAGNGGNDTFNFTGGTVTGSVSGGTGSDTLSYAGRSSAVSVLLGTAATADGYNGAASDIGGGFDTMDVLVGTGLGDSLTGEQVNSTWVLDNSGSHSNSYNDGASNSLVFSAFDHLIGATGNDTFIDKDNTDFAGTIDGGTGSNTLDYSDASNTTGLSVVLTGSNAGTVAGFSFAPLPRWSAPLRTTPSPSTMALA